MNQKTAFLESRLINFSTNVLELVELIPNNKIGNHLGNQLLRSGTSPSLNYGEAQFAESKNDFIHKMKICLKELKESSINMKIMRIRVMINDVQKLNDTISECDELISIFVKSIETAKK